MEWKTVICRVYQQFNRICDCLSPGIDLLCRAIIAYHFIPSALVKLQSWSSTVMLFKYEYHVPLLSPELAATVGTFVELVFPMCLLLGIGGRIPALVLTLFNLMAIYAYRHFLFSDAGSEGLEDHFYWGVILLVTLFHGPGKWSLDELLKLICKKYCCRGK